MSDTIFNLRIFSWHLMLTVHWKIRVSRNDCHRDHNWPDGYVYLYQIGSKHFP